MGAQFLAALQLFVYGGAVTILALFVLMLARPSAEKVEQPTMFGRIAAIGATVTLLATIVVAVFASALPSSIAASPLTSTLAESLFTRYMLPFELAGLLLTVALVGSIVIARGGVGRLPTEKPSAGDEPVHVEIVELGEPASAQAGEPL
jgi:NADH-quinone oxidoreductase subunit J